MALRRAAFGAELCQRFSGKYAHLVWWTLIGTAWRATALEEAAALPIAGSSDGATVESGPGESVQAVTVLSNGGVEYRSNEAHIRRALVREAGVLSVDGALFRSANESKPFVKSSGILGTTTDTVSSSCALVCGAVLVCVIACWLLFWMLPASEESKHVPKLILLCLSFAACSWAMNVLNKALVAVLRTPALVTGTQMILTVAATAILGGPQLHFTCHLPQVTKWLCVPFLFFGMLVSSFFSLEYLTLSMLVVVGNLGPLVSVPIEKAIMPAEQQPSIDQGMILSLVVMLVGAMCYGGGNLHASAIGIGFAALNMALAVANRIVQRLLLTTSCKDLTTETCVLLNNGVGFAPTLLLGYVVNEFQKFDPDLWFHSNTTYLLFLSAVFSSSISYFAVAVQKEISATSFMVLQNVARMAVVAVGILIFRDPVESSWQMLGLVLSCCGAVLYGKAKLDADLKAKAAYNDKTKAFCEFAPNPFVVRRVS